MSLLWPEVEQEAGRRSAVRRGFWAGVVVTVIALFGPPPLSLLAATTFALVTLGIALGQTWAARAGVIAAYAPLLAVGQVDAGLMMGFFVQCSILAYFFFSAWRGLRAAPNPRGLLATILSGVVWLAVSFSFLGAVYFLGAGIYPVTTNEMEDTVVVGDRVAMRPFDEAPRRAEIAVFRNPLDANHLSLLRVAGLPGDRLRIQNGSLLINGQPVAEPFAIHRDGLTDPFRLNFPSSPTEAIPERGRAMLARNVSGSELVVPKGQYFLLADNRAQAHDSRYWGFVDQKDLLGRVQWRVWSDQAQPADSPLAFYTKANWSRFPKRLK
jgi:signal peptidase I